MMRRFYLFAVSALVGASAMAQVSVTFRVDMTGQTVSPNGVHVAGNWQAAAGYPGDWQPGTAQLTDANTDGIYELTVSLPPGSYQYKYINGNTWGSDETTMPSAVTIDGNRYFTITNWHANPVDGGGNPTGPFQLPAVVFGGGGPAGTVAVKVIVDLTEEPAISENGVHVAGDLLVPNWLPAFGAMSPIGSNQFAYTAFVAPNSTYSYKFINDNDWGVDESVPTGCAVAGNRSVTVTTNNVTEGPFCYGACTPCVDPTVVTFLVDMSNVGCSNPLGAHIAGVFNGWSGEPMVDQGNGVYSIDFILQPGTYNFKFQDGPGGWEGSINGACAVPGGGDRTVVVEGPTVTYGPFCFGTCSAECTAAPDLSTITFKVDMTNETVSPNGVWVMGSFTSPAWQGGAIQMTDADSDGIYEATAEVCGPISFEYKFVNGSVSDPVNEEFNAFLDQLPCNVSNGQGGWNRVHVRQGGVEILPAPPFAACGPVNTTNVELGLVRIYPNPSSTGYVMIELENPNGYSLRLNVLDITGKTVISNVLVNNNRFELKTGSLAPGLYFIDVANQHNQRVTYKLMVN